MAVNVAGDRLVGAKVVGVSLRFDAVGDILKPVVGYVEAMPAIWLGFELGFKTGNLVGGLRSPLMHALLICPLYAPLQHAN